MVFGILSSRGLSLNHIRCPVKLLCLPSRISSIEPSRSHSIAVSLVVFFCNKFKIFEG